MRAESGKRDSETVEAQRATAVVERIVKGIESRWANAPEVTFVYDMTDPRITANIYSGDKAVSQCARGWCAATSAKRNSAGNGPGMTALVEVTDTSSAEGF